MKRITKEYSVLFNEITDVSEELIKLYWRLLEAQRRSEEGFLEEDEAEEVLIVSEDRISASI